MHREIRERKLKQPEIKTGEHTEEIILNESIFSKKFPLTYEKIKLEKIWKKNTDMRERVEWLTVDTFFIESKFKLEKRSKENKTLIPLCQKKTLFNY